MSYMIDAENRTENQRLLIAAWVALLLHALVILSIQVADLAPPSSEPVLSLQVSLFKQAGGDPAAASAQAEPTEPTEPLIPPTVEAPANVAPAVPSTPPAASQRRPLPVITTPAPKATVPKRSEPRQPTPFQAAPAKPSTPVETPPRAPLAKPTPAPPASPVQAQSATPVPPKAERPAQAANTRSAAPLSGLELMERSLQTARLETAPRAADASREQRLNDKSMTDLEGFYFESWRRKVERVGALNFPEEARRLNRTAGPTLDVAVRANGTIQSITLVRSSGYSALDKAARRIVELAAPYPPFPEALRRRSDVLHIVRRWNFEQGRLLGN